MLISNKCQLTPMTYDPSRSCLSLKIDEGWLAYLTFAYVLVIFYTLKVYVDKTKLIKKIIIQIESNLILKVCIYIIIALSSAVLFLFFWAGVFIIPKTF